MNAATLSGPNTERSMTPAMRASRILGWVSFAIGAAELLAPRKVARAVGMDEERTGLLRAYGAREIVAGVGAHSVYPVPALWSRVAGDLVDIGTIAMAARRTPTGRRETRAWVAMAAVAGIAVVDALVASRLAAETKEGKGEPRDYSDRSGFPGGVEAARGAGVVVDPFAGKAGGAAAGDVSPAGEAESGRTSTDLAGAPASHGGGASAAGGPAGSASYAGQPFSGSDAPSGDKGSGSSGGSASGGIIGGGQTIPDEAKKVVPEPVGYTPA
jgi:hypothetical protein